MIAFLAAIAFFVAGSVLSLSLNRKSRWASTSGSACAMIGALIGLIAVFRAFQSSIPPILHFDMSLPGATFYLKLDPLSSFFLFVLFALSFVVSLYGTSYLAAYRDQKAIGVHWAFFNGFLASMSLALAAHNVVLFLIAWELMAVLSLFLVTFEHELFSVRRAGFIYFVATNLGTACLLVSFILLARLELTLDYENLRASAETANWVFLLGLVGFGLKAGMIPLHVWLPEAHPAAPSHVSALMSGVMIKLGIYGILRLVQILGGSVPLWWGITIVVAGAVSGILGVLFAICQHDLKRLLAYHSVENIGIILLGTGMGLVGMRYHNPRIAALGFSGALLHVFNHAVFKGLLFLCAGAVAHSTGTRNMDQLGGLHKKMPLTTFCFLIGAVAISGLPPLNGFMSELLIYASGFFAALSWKDGRTLDAALVVASLTTVLSLALIGGLALACFTKVFGIVFLGEPRTRICAKAHEPPLTMTIAMIILAFGCAAIGVFAGLLLPVLAPAVSQISTLPLGVIQHELRRFAQPLQLASQAGCVLMLLIAALAFVRRLLLRRRLVRETVTWDCGFAVPTARMQYSASSYAQPIVDFFSPVLRPQKRHVTFSAFFPRTVRFRSHVGDIFVERVYNRLANALLIVVERLRDIQPASVNFFAGYIIFTLVLLIIWNYFFGAAL